MKRLGSAIVLTISLFVVGSANASHSTFFGTIDAIDHLFGIGGGVTVHTPSSGQDDVWIRFAANVGDNLVISGSANPFMNMVLFREATNGVVEIGDVAGVTNFNVNQTGSGTDLIVQHAGFNGGGIDQYVVPGNINFTTTVAGEYVIGLAAANNLAGFAQQTTVTLSGNTASVGSVVPEPTTLALLGLGLAGVGALRRRKRNA